MSAVEVIILTAEDCLHCIELEAELDHAGLPSAWRFVDKARAHDLPELFLMMADVLPFAGLFRAGACLGTVRAATRAKLEEALESHDV